MGIFEKLSAIQADMRVPKNQRNNFGGYNYRSAEDILEIAKPVCRTHGAVLTISDTMFQMGERYYVQAEATLTNTEDEHDYISVTAFAREEESKKGMDSAQITGATSSYARKYALNGLFNLDDNKDPDTDAYQKVQNEAKKREGDSKIKAQEQADGTITKAEEDAILKMLKAVKAESPLEERVTAICKKYGVEKLGDMKKSQFTHCINMLSKGTK